MISFNFDYYKPATIKETVQLFQSLRDQEKQPVYFSGGTEIITLGRVNKIVADSVIDIKEIPECVIGKKDNNQLVFGAALTLTELLDLGIFPLLDETVSEIADRTARNKITLGGNICANIIYREAVLPFLLTDSQVVIATKDGLKEKSINSLFDQELQLEDGEFLVQIKTEMDALSLPYFSVKKRRQWGVGYPLITVAAIKKEGRICLAYSGLCSFPFRSEEMENCLNQEQLSMDKRMEKAIQHIPGEVLEDVHGSAEYRIFVLKNTLREVFDALEGKE